MVVDTNILLYLIGGDKQLQSYLESQQLYISFITELELLGFKNLSMKEEAIINNLIEMSVVVEMNDAIKRKVIELRKRYSMKLPDAIIAATSIYLDVQLLTADKSFKSKEELNVILYNPGIN